MKKCCFFFCLCLFQLTSYSLLAQEGYVTTDPLVVPVHTQKNQLHVSVGGSDDGFALHTSYTITSHLAVFAASTLKRGTSQKPSIMDGHDRKQTNNSVSAGLGYSFAPTQSGLKLETFAGGGKFKTDYRRYAYQTREIGGTTISEYWKTFVQANLLWQKKHAEAGPALRLAYYSYNQLENVEVIYSPIGMKRFENVWNICVEPVLSFSFIYRKVKLNLQGGLSIPIAESAERVYVNDDFQGQETLRPDLYLDLETHLFGQVALQYNLNLGPKEK